MCELVWLRYAQAQDLAVDVTSIMQCLSEFLKHFACVCHLVLIVSVNILVVVLMLISQVWTRLLVLNSLSSFMTPWCTKIIFLISSLTHLVMQLWSWKLHKYAIHCYIILISNSVLIYVWQWSCFQEVKKLNMAMMCLHTLMQSWKN